MMRDCFGRLERPRNDTPLSVWWVSGASPDPIRQNDHAGSGTRHSLPTPPPEGSNTCIIQPFRCKTESRSDMINHQVYIQEFTGFRLPSEWLHGEDSLRGAKSRSNPGVEGK